MFLLGLLIFLTIFNLSLSPVGAVYNPLSVPNNKLGVHILHPDEINLADFLVNNSGQASWGYVTVPIPLDSLDLDTWNKFMSQASQLKIIPILRLSTTPSGDNWQKPTSKDIEIFANFLDQLNWPTKNRYIIIFNEVNRPNEYGGSVSPEDYTEILSQAIKTFRSRSDKYFILPSAMDNDAPNNNGFMRWDKFLARMYQHNKEIFNKIDGWNSHSYPNPAFGASPAVTGDNKIDSFKTDLEFIKKFTAKKLPIFITETGWSRATLTDQQIASYYEHALVNAWSNPDIVAITPFLLFADTAPFSNFSLLNQDKSPTLAYLAIQKQATIGSPQLEIYPSPISTPSITPTLTQKKKLSPPQVLSNAKSKTNISFFAKLILQIKNMISKIYA